MACAVDEIVRAGLCAPGPAYPVSVTTKTVGYQDRVTFVDAGHQYVVTLTDLSDGTVQISLSNTGSLGASARGGAEVELGPLGGAEAQAQAGGGLYIDAADSVPVFGHALRGFIDSVTGAKGAPSIHSIDGRYLTATALGGGLQGSATAGAGANLGSLGADTKASISAQAGLEHISSGPDKGNWQGSIRLTGDGDGSLGDALFGPHASGIGSIDGEATVTLGPDFTPRKLEISKSSYGVWEVTGQGGAMPEGSVHGGTSLEPGAGEGESGGKGGEPEPLLTLSHSAAGGEGVGTTFVGKLDLTDDPTAQSAPVQVLQGNYSQVSVLVNEMNTHGTEYIQHYHLRKSTSTWGGEVNVGAGGGAELHDGFSTACYDAPRVRHDGGAWTTASYDPSMAC